LPIDTHTLIDAGLIPAAIAAVVVFVDDHFRRRALHRSEITSSPSVPTAGEGEFPAIDCAAPSHRTQASGIVGAVFAALFCFAMAATALPRVNGRPSFAISADWHLLFYVAVAIGAFSVFIGLLKPRWQISAWMLVAVAVVIALSWPRLMRNTDWRHDLASITGVRGAAVAAIALAIPVLVFVQRRRGSLAAACALATVAALQVAAVGFLGKSATLANVAIAPAALMGGAVVILACRRGALLSISSWAVLALLTQSALLVAIDPWSGAMALSDGLPLLFAPIAALAALWGVAERRWAAAAIAIVAVLACCGVPIAHIIDTAFRYHDDGYL
jgi:MFS family permease